MPTGLAWALFIAGLLGIVAVIFALWLGRREPQYKSGVHVWGRLQDRYLAYMLLFVSVMMASFGGLIAFVPDAPDWSYWTVLIVGIGGSFGSLWMYLKQDALRQRARELDDEARTLNGP